MTTRKYGKTTYTTGSTLTNNECERLRAEVPKIGLAALARAVGLPQSTLSAAYHGARVSKRTLEKLYEYLRGPQMEHIVTLSISYKSARKPEILAEAKDLAEVIGRRIGRMVEIDIFSSAIIADPPKNHDYQELTTLLPGGIRDDLN